MVLHLCFTLWQFSSCLDSLNVGGQVGRQVIGVDVDADILNMALHNSMELEVVLLSLHKAKEQSNFSFHKYASIDVGYQRSVLVQVAHFRSDLHMVQFCNAVLSLMDAVANCGQFFSPKLSYYCHGRLWVMLTMAECREQVDMELMQCDLAQPLPWRGNLELSHFV